jgi:hypothetical protein
LATTSTTSGNWNISQSLETRDVVRFQGQAVTVSFWYRIPVYFSQAWGPNLFWTTSVDTAITNAVSSAPNTAGSGNMSNTTTWTYTSFQATVPSNAQALSVLFSTYNNIVNGATIQITGVQLERGTVATPFEVRPYATELALCQRYFTQLGGQMLYNYFGSGLASSATSAYILCPLPVPMRYPNGSTVTTVGSFNLLGLISGTYGNAAVSSIAKDQQNINNIELIVACTNMTTGYPYMLYVSNSLANLLQINNEL